MALRQIGEVAGAVARLEPACRLAFEFDIAEGGDKSGQRLEQRGFAGAVRTDQGHEFASGQCHAGIVDDGASAEPNGDVCRRQQRRGHDGSPSSQCRSLKIM